MLPIDFPQQNKVYTKPEGQTDEQCMSLSVHKTIIDGVPTFISAWKPSYEDIEAIKAGKPIWLYIQSHSLPPASLQTENPFEPEQ